MILWKITVFILAEAATECSLKKSVLKDFAKITGKHLCQGLFFNKVAGVSLQPYKKESLAQVFFVNFVEFLSIVNCTTAFVKHYFLIPSSTENNFIYLSIRQGIKYKLVCSVVVSVYSSTIFFITTWLTA